MKKIAILLSGLLAIPVCNGISQDCTTPEKVFSFQFQGKKYEIVKELYSWNVASQCAADRGGYLVQINSKAEQDTVFRSIINGAKVSTTYKPVNDGGGASYVWIGANDKANEGTWIWDGDNDGAGTQFWSGQGSAGANNGEVINGLYNNWGGASVHPNNPALRNEPDNYNGNQDGAAMALAGWPVSTSSLGITGEWNDIGITATLYFVVEYDSSSTTNPEKLSARVNVFPSPATDYITVTSSGSQNPLVEIRLYNILGSEVYRTHGIRTCEYNINLSDYQPGIYFVHTALEQGQVTKQKVIIR